MAGIVYFLCAITALLCSVLLLRHYWRTGYRLLLWSGLCFAGLTLNNLFLIIDRLVLPDMNLLLLRHTSGLIAMSLLLYGLVWDSE